MIISDYLHAPALYGFFRPVIIVPAGMFTHLSFEQVELILMHELIHLKKADFLVNLFQQLVESIMFFNPFTWMISGLIREEREKHVDDIVTARGSSTTYARALFNLSLLQTEGSVASLAATGGGQKLLLKRIQRILKSEHMKKGFKTRLYLTGIVSAGLIMIVTLSGFSSTLWHFDRQQTHSVQSVDVPEKGDLREIRRQAIADVPGPEISNSVEIRIENQDDHSSNALLKIDRDESEAAVISAPDQDTLTDKERKELLKELRQAREELESIDWEQEMARLEEERARLMAELPELLEEEHLRIREELSRIDEEMIRKEMEQARRHLDSVRQHLDMDEMHKHLEQSRKRLEKEKKIVEEQMREGAFPDEKTREAMARSLEALQSIDVEEMMANMEEAMMNLHMDMHFDFDHDLEIDINPDSMMIDMQRSLQDFDIERIKEEVDRSVRRIEKQIEELKSSDTSKKEKN
jgi:hypothetical protein